MKRSQINVVIADACAILAEFRWSLPAWAQWRAEDFAGHPEQSRYLQRHQMGWDVTDFDAGDFNARGLALFCVRNGIQSDPRSLPYAEKLLFIGECQETPFHAHKVKMEDIINRGGGNLMIEFRHAEKGRTAPITVNVDGAQKTLAPEVPLRLLPGQSVTIPRRLYHRFYAEKGHGTVFGGEVSQVNDDGSDNYFWEPLGRFSDIEEDEPASYPLWNELDAL